MYRIALAAHVGFIKTNIIESPNDTITFFSGNHQFFAVDVYRVIFDKVYSHRSFGDKHGVFLLVDFEQRGGPKLRGILSGDEVNRLLAFLHPGFDFGETGPGIGGGGLHADQVKERLLVRLITVKPFL